MERFLNRFPGLFGHDATALKKARVTREDVTAHNGMSTLVWNQEVNGIPVFKTVLKANVSNKRELVTISDHFVSQPKADLQAPKLTAERAITLAAASLDDRIAETDVRPTTPPEGAEQMQRFTANGQSDTSAQLTYFPMNETDVRLGWEVVTTSLAQNQMFQFVIGADNGEVIYRHSLTVDISNASYRVYADATTKKPFDSPTPKSPGFNTPTPTQPPVVARQLITLQALDTTASPNGWINDGNQETLGNNVDAHTDLDTNNVADTPRPNGGAARVFDFPIDLTQTPVTYKEASATHLFYMNNWTHDRLYQLGFTESAGNFQTKQFQPRRCGQ